MIVRLVLTALLFAAPDAFADARTDVQAALGRLVDEGGFSARVDGQVFGAGVAPVSGEVDVVFPDRMHVRSESLEFIVVGDEAWLAAFGYWTPTRPELLPVTAFDPPAMRKAIAAIRDVRDEGTAKTAACEARVYAFRASGPLPGAEADGDVRVWLCAGTGRLARLEASDRDGQRVKVEFRPGRRPQVSAP